VSLLRSALRDIDKAVYWDDDFEAGDAWFEQMTRHIDTTPQLFVFWCRHAAESAQVRREFMYAFEREKRVVPVLLDDAPLAEELAAIHGIDLRGAVTHGGLFHRFGSAAVVVSLVAAAMIFVFSTWSQRARVPPQTTTTNEPAQPSPADPLPAVVDMTLRAA